MLNERGFSVKSNLQSISSNSFCRNEQFFGSNSNVILSRQTCFQHSSIMQEATQYLAVRVSVGEKIELFSLSRPLILPGPA